MDIHVIALIAIFSVAGASAMTALVNLGVDRVRPEPPDEKDQPPAVVNVGLAAALGLGVGLPAALALGMYAGPLMSLLGAGLGLAVALGWRGLRLRRWVDEVTRDMQALLTILIIQLDSGGDSVYRALECALAESNLIHLRPIVERHVLARKAAGVPLEQALSDLARCRLLRDAPLVQDALARLADLVARDVPTGNLIEVLRLMDTLMTDIARVEREQASLSAQTRYSTYIVALLVAAMGAAVLFIARDLGDLLLHTVPGNLTLLAVCGAVGAAIVIVERSTSSRPLRF